MAETTGDKIIIFRTPEDEWGEFSNQYAAPFEYMGIRFETVEQFLYYMKAVFGRSKATAEQVLACGGDSAALAKTTRKQHLLENNSWEDVRPQMMRVGMRQKFLQNPELRKKLLGTGFRLIVEIQKEGLLGFLLPANEDWVYNPSKWKDRNQTGKVLMRVRADLRNANRLVEADEAYVFPKAPFVLQTPIGQMSLQELSALPGARESVKAYTETARQYLELFLATPENLGNISGIPLVAMERYIAGTNADIQNTLNRAKAREALAEQAESAAAEQAAAEETPNPVIEEAPDPVTEEAPDAAAETTPADTAAAEAAPPADAAITSEENPGTETAGEGSFGTSPEKTADAPAIEMPDDIPPEGFYELLYDLDEMMKLGLI